MWEPALWSALLCHTPAVTEAKHPLSIFNWISELRQRTRLLTNLVEASFSELHKCHLHRLKNIGEKNRKDTGHVINSV